MKTDVNFRTESFNEFKAWWLVQLAGTVCYRVRTYDGNTGNKVGVEWSSDEQDLEDMREVLEGYYTETATLTRTAANQPIGPVVNP